MLKNKSETVTKSSMHVCTLVYPSDDIINSSIESEFFVPSATANCNESTPATQGNLKEPINTKKRSM